ncbi:hypothetical protein Tco_1003771 [Tanacetum coccineum]|uniref:Integrase, catalytic region, zinc finger, CCHC-type, peptidase aspartic, catalytic n=1 Tax=Tanacetum coccineum TaxID=301880 RepID=A0ABQ5FA15_9ASTR
MLDRSNFASWQQRICLYCMGKDNGANIIKSIDEGPFKMGKFREMLAEGEEGALHLGPEQDRVFADLSPEEKDRFMITVKLNRGLKESSYDQALPEPEIHKYSQRNGKSIVCAHHQTAHGSSKDGDGDTSF